MLELYLFFCLATGTNCQSVDTKMSFDTQQNCEFAGEASKGIKHAGNPDYVVKKYNCLPIRGNETMPMWKQDDNAPHYSPNDTERKWK